MRYSKPGTCCAQKRAQGLYISEKLDLLIQYLLVNPFQALYSRVFKREARPHSLAPCKFAMVPDPSGYSRGVPRFGTVGPAEGLSMPTEHPMSGRAFHTALTQDLAGSVHRPAALHGGTACPALPRKQCCPQARLPLGVTMEGGASNQGFTMGGGPTPDNQGYTVSSPTPTAPPAAPTATGLPKDLTDWPHKPVEAGAAPPAPAVEVLPKAAMAWDPVQEPAGAAGEPRLEPVAPVGGGNGAGEGGAGGRGGTGHHTPDQARRRIGRLAAACMAACRAASV